MKKRPLLLALGGALVLLVAILAAAYHWLSRNDYEYLRSAVADMLREEAGLELSIDGDVSVGFSLVPTVTLAEVSLKNPNWDGEQTLFSASRLEARFELVPLIRKGEFNSKTIVLVNGKVNVDRRPDGTSNWSFDTTPSQTTATSLPSVVSVNLENVGVYMTGPDRGEKHVFLFHSLNGTAPEHGEATAITGTGLIDELEFSIDGTIDTWQAFRKGREADLDLSIKMKENTAKLSGTLGKVGERLDEGIEFDISGSTLSFLNPWIPVVLPQMEAYAATGTVTAKSDIYTIGVDSLSVTHTPFVVTATGGITFDGDKIILNTSVDAKGENLHEAGKWLAGLDVPADKLPVTGTFDVKATLKGDPESLAISDIDATVQTTAGSNAFKGGIANVNELSGMNIDVVVSGTNLAELLAPVASLVEIDFSLPVTKSYFASANIAGDTQALGASAIDVKVSGNALDAAITGSIADVIKFSGIDLSVNANGKNLQTVTEKFGVSTLSTQFFEAKGNVTGSVDNLSVPTVNGSLVHQDTKVTVGGSIGKLQPLQGLNLNLNVSGDDLSALSDLAGVDLPATTSFDAKWKLQGNMSNLSASGIDGQLKLDGETVAVTGDISDLLEVSGLALNVRGSGQHLDKIAKLVDFSLPADISHEVSADLSGSLKGGLQLSDAASTFDYMDTKITLNGGIADVMAMTGINISFGVAGPADQIALLAGKDWDDAVVVNASGTVTGTPTNFDLGTFSVNAGHSKSSGNLAIALDDQPSVKGSLGVTVLDLGQKDPVPDEERTDTDVSFQWLDILDLDIAYEELTIMRKDAQFKLDPGRLTMEDGQLNLDPLAVHYRDDLISGRIKIDGPSDAMSMTIQGTDIDFGQLLADLDISEAVTASGDFYVDLSATGSSKDQLIASLAGQSRFLIGEGQVAQVGSTNLNYVAQLVPWRDKSAPLQFSCFLASMTINNGIIDPDSFFLNASDMVVTGGGKIDLVEDSIDVAISPRAKKKSYLSTNISLFMTGPLDQPKVSVGKLSAISDVGLKYGSWAVLGPFALALPFIHNSKKAPDCATVTQGILEKQGAASAATPK